MTDAPAAAPSAPAVRDTAGERARIRRFGLAILVRAVVGTALWIAVHQSVAMTAALVVTCWWPAWLVRCACAVLEPDRERARQHLANAGLVVFLATAAWTLWGLVLLGRGKEVEGWALTLLWTFLFLCFVVDFVLFRWGMRALPSLEPEDPGLPESLALRPDDTSLRAPAAPHDAA